MDFDFEAEPLGHGRRRHRRVPARHLALGAGRAGRRSTTRSARRCSPRTTPTCSPATSAGARCPRPRATTFEWDPDSTYVRKPPYFEGMQPEPAPVAGHQRRPGAGPARRLGDHRPHLPRRLDQGGHPGRAVPQRARRGEEGLQLLRLPARQPRGDDPRHVRQHPAAQPAAGRRCVSGGYTRDFTAGGEQAFIYDAAQHYAEAGIPLVVLGGKEYGSGSSRDWAAKGTALLGVKAVIVESYERIHRSNLIGMGVLPLQFPDGESAESLRPGRHRDLRHHRGHRAERRLDAAHGARHGDQGRAARPSSSTPRCGSTPPARPTTTATAGSCSTCCAGCCERSSVAPPPRGAGAQSGCVIVVAGLVVAARRARAGHGRVRDGAGRGPVAGDGGAGGWCRCRCWWWRRGTRC